MIYKTNSAKETQKLAEKIAKEFKNKGGIIALIGDLGAGKTTFVQGFAKTLGIKDKIISPTFVLIRQHKIPRSNKILFHLDLYRLNSLNEALQIGIEDLLKSEDFILIEWAEKINKLLPKKTYYINFELLRNNLRKISIN